MTTTPTQHEAISENEAWYDAEIAPVLADLAKRCNERGMSFIATVEYDEGKRGGTYYLTEDADLSMRMVYLCSRSAPNVDSFLINLTRHCVEKGIDIGQSMFLKRFSK